MRTAWTVLRKDLRLELRTAETVPAMVLFAVVTMVIFHFAFNRDTIAGQQAAGVLVIALLFAAMLGINRLFVAEREQGGFDAVPAFKLFLLGPGLGRPLPGLVLVLALTNLALSVIGTLVSAIAVHTRARDLIGPVIGLPLLIPALIAAARAAGPILQSAHAPTSPPLKWVGTLALYDLVFALLAYAVFDFLLEE